MQGLFFTPDQLEIVHRHARDVMPKEAVGILGGYPDGRVVKIIPLPNRAHDCFSFYADPYAQYCAEKEIESNGLKIIGIYHSHPRGAASLSQDDLYFAKEWRCAHVVVAVHSAGSPVMKAYHLQRGRPVEIQVRVQPALNGSRR
jgi:proteasome lid subunit RPN8/RPN11